MGDLSLCTNMLQQGLDMGWVYPVALGRTSGQIFLCYSSIPIFQTPILLSSSGIAASRSQPYKCQRGGCRSPEYMLQRMCSVPGMRWENPGVCFLPLVLSLPGGGWRGLLVSPKMTRHSFLCRFYQPSAFWLLLHISAAFASLPVRNARENHCDLGLCAENRAQAQVSVSQISS